MRGGLVAENALYIENWKLCALVAFGGNPNIIIHIVPEEFDIKERHLTNKYLAALKKEVGRLPSKKLCNWPRAGVRLQGQGERLATWNQAQYLYVKYLKTSRHSWKPFLDLYVLDQAKEYLHVFQLSKLRRAIYRSLSREQCERANQILQTYIQPCLPMSLTYGRFKLLPNPKKKRGFLSWLRRTNPPQKQETVYQKEVLLDPPPLSGTQLVNRDHHEEEDFLEYAANESILMDWINSASDLFWPLFRSESATSLDASEEAESSSAAAENAPLDQPEIRDPLKAPPIYDCLPAWKKFLRLLPLNCFFSECEEPGNLENSDDEELVEYDDLKWVNLMRDSPLWFPKSRLTEVQALSQALVWVEQTDPRNLDPLMAAIYHFIVDSRRNKKGDEAMWLNCWESLDNICELKPGLTMAHNRWTTEVIGFSKTPSKIVWID
eukprot:Protomagalhaensia_wolfi_Nauph_80__265@NODE_114_length_3602_cov_145_161942_g87_i0_p1_GENE_NODE_114_length_3602_cov_145_161942_g87_i0NODE_114_length_3602_cov_145_161942_g87_i0_p1_ORF_typecomplete_len436_score85_19FAD_binding_8/PF08022_12/0_2_NODE_114_length_3602_cov_145_161942_g87_i0561363